MGFMEFHGISWNFGESPTRRHRPFCNAAEDGPETGTTEHAAARRLGISSASNSRSWPVPQFGIGTASTFVSQESRHIKTIRSLFL